MKHFVINIGRQLGSGGRAVGHKLAERFGISYYDREILEMAARESGLCPEVFERSDERNNFMRTLGNIIPLIGGGATYYGHQLSGENLFRIQSEAIRHAAGQGSCVFIGRCADYVLRDKKRCANVFVSADYADRVKRLCLRRVITAQAAEKLIRQGDQQRSQYYNFYSDGTWGSADTYHLCINSSVFGIEGTTEFIAEFIEKKLGISRPAK